MLTIDAFRGKYRFLSNFYPHPFTWNGTEWPSAEHAFQASKIDLKRAKDNREWLAIRDAPSPKHAKRLGRECELRKDWRQVKERIMFSILLAKFDDEELRQKLLDTRDAYLVEGNTWGDTEWGLDTKTNRGQNKLGILLMCVRTVIAEDELDELFD